ncbi:hypothetical protein [Ornithinibacillus halophilus]|nr:hypothetical protein [Ornithinibacillus halophilus]
MNTRLSNDDLLKLIEILTPKIKKSLGNTKLQDQEDLQQEIKLKILESREKLQNLKPQDFEGFLAQFIQSKNDIIDFGK